MSTSIHTLEPAKETDDGSIEVINEDAFLLTQWLEKGVFEALVDKYLKGMTFAIMTTHPHTQEEIVLEEYDFNLAYCGAGGQQEALLNGVKITKQSLKDQANKFVRALIEFSSTLDHIPEHRWITLQLSYVDETPTDYQPMFFTDATNSLPLLLGENFINIKIGKLQTPHHRLDVEFKGVENFDALLESDHSFSTSTATSISHKKNKMKGTPSAKSTFRGSSLPREASVQPESKEEEARFTPPSTGTDGDTADSDEPSPESPYEMVKTFLLKERKSVMVHVCQALSLSSAEVKRQFTQLLSEGFLKMNKRQYVLADSLPSESSLPKQRNAAPAMAPSAPRKVNRVTEDTATMEESEEEGEEELEKKPLAASSISASMSRGRRNLTKLTPEVSQQAGFSGEVCTLPAVKAPSVRTRKRVVPASASEEISWSPEVPLQPTPKKRKLSIIKEPLHLYDQGFSQKSDMDVEEAAEARADYSYSQQSQ